MAFAPPSWYKAAHNPTLPLVLPVPGGLWPGMAVFIQGVTKQRPDQISVDLATGPQEDADIALHVNPRFGEGVTVLNSRLGGRWGDEERRKLQPLSPGKLFEMTITVTADGYWIQVNGTFYKEFSHRLPPEEVKVVKVKGDVELHLASVLGGRAMRMAAVNHPAVPYRATIPGGMVPKKTIIIQGFVHEDANRFLINLRAGIGGDIVMQMTARMDQGNSVVRNSFLGGSWGHEETEISGHSPFQRGRYFDLSIRCGNHSFKVFANGQPLFEFQHRVPAGPHVDVLEIEGDVDLSYVSF